MKTIVTFRLALSSLTLMALALLSPNSAQTANLVQDGSFEAVQSSTICVGQSFGAWVVERGAVDVTPDDGGHWPAADGTNSVDLSGSFGCASTIDGSIYQDLPTTPGALYRLRFALAGNFVSGPQIKEMQLRWGDSNMATLFFDTAGRSGSNMGWTNYEYFLSATSAVTRLTFSTPILTGYGPVIDNVFLERLLDDDLLASIHFSAVDVCWAGRTNQMYQVQYRTNISDTNWFDFGSPVLGTGTNCVTDGINGMQQRFYRIFRVP